MSNVFVSTACVPGAHPVSAILDRYRAAGIDSVELGSSHVWEDVAEAPLRVQFGQFHLTVHNYFPPPRKSFALNPISRQAHIRQRTAAHYRTAATFAALAGARVYSFHPGFRCEVSPPGAADGQRTAFGIHSLDALLPAEAGLDLLAELWSDTLADLHGGAVVLAVENQGHVVPHEHLLLQEPWEAERLIAATARRRPIRFLLDTGHLGLAAAVHGFRPEAFLEVVAPHIAAWHIHDNDGSADQHGLPGPDGLSYRLLRHWWRGQPVVLEAVSADVAALASAAAQLEAFLAETAV